MTFRGIIRNGEVVFPAGIDLPEGTEVDVQPVKPRRGRSRGGAASSKAVGRVLPGLGLWKDRPEMSDPVAYLKRQRGENRARRGAGG